MKNIKLFEDFINEKLTKEEAKEHRDQLKTAILKDKITSIDISEIVYQYRYNGVQMFGKCYSGEKEIEDCEDFFSDLAYLQWSAIKKGGNTNGSGDMPANGLVKLLPNIEIKMNGEIVNSDSWLDVEEGNDS